MRLSPIIVFLLLILSFNCTTKKGATNKLIEYVIGLPGSVAYRYEKQDCTGRYLTDYDSTIITTISKLVKDGADPNALVNDSTSLIMYATMRNNGTVVTALAQNGANPNVYTRFHESPLYIHILRGAYAVAEELVKAGADVNAKELCDGATPLMAAVHYVRIYDGIPWPCFVKFLLEHGADINILNNDSSSALILSMQYLYKNSKGQRIYLLHNDTEMAETVDTLLKYKPELNIKDRLGNSPLGLAIMSYSDNICYMLYAKGARLACEQRHGNILLDSLLTKYKNSNGTIRYELFNYETFDHKKFISDSCVNKKSGYPCNKETPLN